MKIFKKILKWTGIGFLLLVLLILGVSEYKLRIGPEPVPVSMDVPSDTQSILEGERLARIRGCSGCHAPDLAGNLFMDDPLLARITAPNLTALAETESVEKLEAAIRQGIGVDGRPLVVMPSNMYSHLDSQDTAKIIAYMRSVPVMKNDFPANFFGPLARFFIAIGVFKTAPDLIEENMPFRMNPAEQPVLAKGEYLAKTVCTQCHGPDLEGVDTAGFITPDLMVAAAYTYDDFARLMETGEGAGGRELSMMTPVAKGRFSQMTDEEVFALYSFLKHRAENRPPQ